MFRRLLVANRGEVAARILRTARRMGIETVAVSSAPDRALSYLDLADEVVELPGRRPYLDQAALIEAAEATRCSALHPGWGFLAENPTFAARCDAARITFVGPRPRSMREMADKSMARSTMSSLGLAPVPGTSVLPTPESARQAAEQMGPPVLLKALAGGGGRGMRRVFAVGEAADAFSAASAESAAAFGDGRMYMEKLITRGRHIEFQVLGDGNGDVRVLGARECSVQRRHQKLIEETPAPGISPQLYAATAAHVVRACSALRYRGAGTVEMLYDADTDELWFMEMNTRLQVEHTVTEEVTGIDLVEWQLKVAANHGLASFPDIEPRGHSIECRINAEQVSLGFRPTPGAITKLVLPEGEGIRVDTHLAEGDRISPHYDSMFAKVIVHADTRAAAIDRMDHALASLVVEGVPTTAALHRRILRHPEFASGSYDTLFLERELEGLLA
jgi:acetyl-CoA carboxylase biotin carboxylase subunit